MPDEDLPAGIIRKDGELRFQMIGISKSGRKTRTTGDNNDGE